MPQPPTRAILRAGHPDRPCKRWFHLLVHDDARALRDAARRYGRPVDEDDDGENGCVGCVHGVPAPGYRNGYSGIVRLSRGWLTTEIVSHEMVHAALVVFRQDVQREVRLTRRVSDREEQLAYLQGILMQAATILLVDLGLWRDLGE